MTNVSKDKTVKISIGPVDPDPSPSKELGEYFHSELRKRSKIEDVDLS